MNDTGGLRDEIVCCWCCGNSGGGSGSRLPTAQRKFRISAGIRAWLQPESQGDWLFTVGGGRFVQSSPRPEARFLHQPALEGLTRSARTETPRNGDRNKSDQREICREMLLPNEFSWYPDHAFTT
ncbi:Linoleoyl-CoA desaturase (ISS) [Dorcoceras hygrometricum]|uniref:Linoleoyl-CoA desaturase (ISS) n=1 Tax=Dorcoceras hygrometricum TaxID=472368 RepID=A0A2Z7ASN8_9LAMI|nr:Linoleoyl-CoA desaturase (ISS) [Dorcoceras hygrometricum]